MAPVSAISAIFGWMADRRTSRAQTIERYRRNQRLVNDTIVEATAARGKELAKDYNRITTYVADTPTGKAVKFVVMHKTNA